MPAIRDADVEEGKMKRVATAELIRNFGVHGDIAMSSPVIVTKNDRDRLVLISIEQYEQLKHVYNASEDGSAKSHRERAKRLRRS